MHVIGCEVSKTKQTSKSTSLCTSQMDLFNMNLHLICTGMSAWLLNDMLDMRITIVYATRFMWRKEINSIHNTCMTMTTDTVAEMPQSTNGRMCGLNSTRSGLDLSTCRLLYLCCLFTRPNLIFLDIHACTMLLALCAPSGLNYRAPACTPLYQRYNIVG